MVEAVLTAARFARCGSPDALGFLAIAAATLERLQKMAYRRLSVTHYGSSFTTEFFLDTGHLADNLVVQLRLIGHLSWWPLDALAPVCCSHRWQSRRRHVIRKNEAVHPHAAIRAR